MNLKTWAEGQGISINEAKKRTGLTHWNQTVEIKQEDEAAVVAEDVDLDVIELSIRCLGSKSPYWSSREKLEG